MKNNESDNESEKITRLNEEVALWMDICKDLRRRVADLEDEIRTMQRGDNTGFRHENDGGYFD